MGEQIITRQRDGYRFRLVASHTGTAPIDGLPSKAGNCGGCGTRTRIDPAGRGG